MTMRSYIELYIHDNDTDPGKKSLRMSVKSPPPHKKKWEAAISGVNEGHTLLIRSLLK